MDINKMTLDELKDYLQKMKESLDEEYEILLPFFLKAIDKAKTETKKPNDDDEAEGRTDEDT